MFTPFKETLVALLVHLIHHWKIYVYVLMQTFQAFGVDHRTYLAQATSSNVDSVVRVVRFISTPVTSLLRNDSRPIVERRAVRPNDTLYLRADFAGLTVYSMVLTAMATAYRGGAMTERYNTNPLDAVPAPPTVCEA